MITQQQFDVLFFDLDCSLCETEEYGSQRVFILIAHCVLCFAGVDPDGGQIRYSISGPVFSVDRDTGVVRLRQELDREKQNTIEVIISITGESVNFVGIQTVFVPNSAFEKFVPKFNRDSSRLH